MLGYTNIENNICIFLENNDIKNLNKNTIRGTYINQRDESKRGLVELSKLKTSNDSIDNVIAELKNKDSGINTVTDDTGAIIKINVEIRSSAYYDLIEFGYSESNNQNRKVLLYDAKRVLHYGNAFDQLAYGLLKKSEADLNKRNKKHNIWNILWQVCLNQ